MKGFFSSTRFKVLLVILFLLIGFIVGAAGSGTLDNIPSTVVNFIMSPIEKLVTSISNGTMDFFKRFTRAEALYEENLLLKDEINVLTDEMIEFEQMKQRIQQYEALLKISEENDDRAHTVATVVAMDPEDPFLSFTIDKGEMDGISVGDAVITSKSLVGEIVSITPKSATVRTILDINIALGADTVKAGENGVISGDLELATEGFTRMSNISKNAEIDKGDAVLTTGVAGGTYPKGLKIGTVESVHKESFGTSMYAIIKPYEDISDLKDVFVIVDFKGKGADALPQKDEEEDKKDEENESVNNESSQVINGDSDSSNSENENSQLDNIVANIND